MKKIFIVLVIAFSLFTLASCHGAKEKSGFDVPEEFDVNKEYNITFWAKNDSNIVQKNIYKNTIERFNEYYPNIHVTIQNYSDYTKIYNDVIKNISTNTTPNVCITYPDFVATYIEGDNVVVPLDDLMNDSKFGFGGSSILYPSIQRSDLIDKFIDELIIDGMYYAIPFVRSSEATYINEDIVKELGFSIPDVLTWDFVWEVCEKAKEAHPEKTFIPMIYKSTDNMFIQMAKQRGIDFTTEDGDILLFNDGSKELLKELAVYGLNNYYDTFKRVSYPGNFFNAGNCIFAIDSTAGATWIGSDAPLMDIHESDVKQFTTVVRTVPQTDENNLKMISQGPSICIFNKEDNDEVLASWIFAQFLLNDETQISYAKTEGYVPVTKTATNSSDYQDYLSRGGEDNDTYYKVKIDASKLVIENTENTFITPVFNGSSLVRSASGELIETTLQSVKSKSYEDSDAWFEKLFSETSVLYKLDELSNNRELGELPSTSKILLISLGSIWVLIGGYYLLVFIKNKKKKNQINEGKLD